MLLWIKWEGVRGVKVLSPGEKIKQLRKGIGLKQEDIVKDEITRSLVSMIENNKRNLTYRTAKVIANALNSYYVHLGKEITPEFLLETDIEQAQRLIFEHLRELQPLLIQPELGSEEKIEAAFDQLIQFAGEWQLEELVADLWVKKGNFYQKIHRYNQGIHHYHKALEYYLKTCRFNRVAEIYHLVGNCYYHLALYEQALVYYQRMKDILEAYPIENQRQIEIAYGINTTLCYRKLKRYDMVLRSIAFYKETEVEEGEFYYRILLIEANTHRDLGNYDQAIAIYEKLLKKSTELSPSMGMLISESYGELYQMIQDYEKSLNCLQYSHHCHLDHAPDYGPRLCLTEAKANFAIGKVEEAFGLVEKGIAMAQKTYQISWLLKLRFFQVKMHLELGNYAEAEAHLMGIEQNLSMEERRRNLAKVYVFYIDLYCRWDKKERCLSYISRLQGME